MNPKVSVIIPVYNVENYVRPCIESALAQTLKEIEIIIIDDGSTDSSPQIIDYYAKNDSRIVPVHRANAGYGSACNHGFDIAKGEYVAILESDDFIDPDMYESLYNYAVSLDADVVKSPYKDCFLKDVIKPYPHNDYLSRNMPRKRLYSLRDCPCQLATHQSIWAGIYRRAYMNDNNIRFDEVPGAGHVDIKFCVESLVYSKKLAWLDQPFYNYRVEREGSSTAEYSIKENATRYLEMHEFLLSYDKALFRAVAPQLVTRECTGLYRYFKKIAFSDEELELMKKLLDAFTEEEISRAPIISQKDKQELQLLKKGIVSLTPNKQKSPSDNNNVQKAPKNTVKKDGLTEWAFRLSVTGLVGLTALEIIRSNSTKLRAPLLVLESAVGLGALASAGALCAAFAKKMYKKLR